MTGPTTLCPMQTNMGCCGCCVLAVPFRAMPEAGTPGRVETGLSATLSATAGLQTAKTRPSDSRGEVKGRSTRAEQQRIWRWCSGWSAPTVLQGPASKPGQDWTGGDVICQMLKEAHNESCKNLPCGSIRPCKGAVPHGARWLAEMLSRAGREQVESSPPADVSPAYPHALPWRYAHGPPDGRPSPRHVRPCSGCAASQLPRPAGRLLILA